MTVGRKGKREVSSPSKEAVRLTQHQVKSSNFGSAGQVFGSVPRRVSGWVFSLYRYLPSQRVWFFSLARFVKKTVSRKRRGRKNVLILSTPIESERFVPRLFWGIMAYRV